MALTWAFLAIGMGIAGVGAATAGPAEWEALFNGRDLTGWRAPDLYPFWTVSNGVFVGASGPEMKGHVSFTEREFGDLELELEARWTGDVDSGIFLRSPPIQV